MNVLVCTITYARKYAPYERTALYCRHGRHAAFGCTHEPKKMCRMEADGLVPVSSLMALATTLLCLLLISANDGCYDDFWYCVPEHSKLH